MERGCKPRVTKCETKHLETNKLSKTVVSVDLRNIDKPIIRFRKAPPVEYIGKDIRRLAG